MNALPPILFAAVWALAGITEATPAEPAGAMKPLSSGQFHYQESCGGCHGLLGSSSRDHVPELRGAVGRFLCTDEGRRYIVRLPNVAFANMDAKALADTMNFIVFSLGGGSAPKGAKPFTAAEVGKLRLQPLKSQPLVRMRADIWGRAVQQCAALEKVARN